MSLILSDRVLETASSPGTGTVTLLGAVTGYQSFASAIGNTNTTYYTIADQSGSNWEVGIGTVTTGSPNTLARTTVLASSNSGSLVNFASGTQNVFVTYPAERSVYSNGTNIVGPSGTPLAVTSGGTGYTVAPSVTITSTGGGSGATFTVAISGGAVTGVTVTSGGTGYKGTVTATFTGGNGITTSVSGQTVTISSIGAGGYTSTATGGTTTTIQSGFNSTNSFSFVNTLATKKPA